MIQPGGELALLPAAHQSPVLAGLICANEVRASYAVMISYSPLIWRLLQRTMAVATGSALACDLYRMPASNTK